MNDNNFSNAFNLFLEYGKVSIEAPHLEQYKCDLNKDINAMADTGNFPTDMIAEDVENLTSRIQTKINFWQNASFLITPEDELRDAAELTLYFFDKTVYFFHAVSTNSNPKISALKTQAEILLSTVFTALTEKNTFSMLRMVPLNDYRTWKINHIPEEYRHLYPWYDIYHNLPENFLVSLADHWNELLENDFSKIELPAGISPRIIIEELNADSSLRQAIISHYQESVYSLNLLRTALPQRLWYLSDYASYEESNWIDSDLADKGLIRLAKYILNESRDDVPVFSKLEEWTGIGRIFLVAFCNAGLSEDEKQDILKRIEIFEWVLGRLDSFPDNLQADLPDELQIMVQLKQWREGRNDSFDFANFVYRIWNQRLEKIATGLVQKIDESPESLLQAINEAKDSMVISVGLSNFFKKHYIADNYYIEEGKRIAAGGRGADDQATIRFTGWSSLNTVYSIKPRNNELRFPVIPVSDNEDSDATNDLGKFLSSIQSFFSFGFVWNEAGEREALDIVNHIGGDTRKHASQLNGKNIIRIFLVLVFEKQKESVGSLFEYFKQCLDWGEPIKPHNGIKFIPLNFKVQND